MTIGRITSRFNGRPALGAPAAAERCVRPSMAMMTRIGSLVLASATLLLSGCNRDRDPSAYDLSDRDRWQPVQFETVELPPQWPDQDLFMGSDTPATKLFCSQAELDAAWPLIYVQSPNITPPGFPLPPKPNVDFSSRNLLIVTLGAIHSSGPRISVQGVYESPDAILVRVVQRWPGLRTARLAIIEHPMVAIVLPVVRKPLLVDRCNEIQTRR